MQEYVVRVTTDHPQAEEIVTAIVQEIGQRFIDDNTNQYNTMVSVD